MLLEELDFAASCLRGELDALQRLEAFHGKELTKFLLSIGASATDARELVVTLLADCTVSSPQQQARLHLYNGRCSLLAWLKTLAVHRLISVSRREQRRRVLRETKLKESVEPFYTERASADDLLQIMRSALLSALQRCRAEDVILLQLVHLHGLTQRELAVYWKRTEASISRLLDSAKTVISRETLAEIRRFDPLLDISWDDFLDLCQGAEGTLFSRKSRNKEK